MPIEKKIKLYTFKELNKNTRDDVISSYLQDLPSWWSDDVEERIRNEAEVLGIKDFDFSWSGFWSQGDGLSFTGSLSFKTWLFILAERLDDKQFSKLGINSPADVVMLQEANRVDWGTCIIKRMNHMYVNENTVSVQPPDSELGWDERRGYPSDNERMEKFGVNVQKALNKWKNELCNKWYSDLLETYESHIDRDNIIKNITCSGSLFTSSGVIINDIEFV